MSAPLPICEKLRTPDRHDPSCPFAVHCYCDGALHDTVSHPDGPEAADIIEALYEALEKLVAAVNTNELASAMACHSIISFSNVEEALTPALAALARVRGEP